MGFDVLVVDDEPMVETLFRQKFRREQKDRAYNFLFAGNGEEAMQIINKTQIDIVISDINMPKMNGLELLEAIQANSSVVKTIMVTAYGDMENIRTAMNHGAFDFLTKPIDFVDLKQTLEKTCTLVQHLKDGLNYRNDIVDARNLLSGILPNQEIYGDGGVKVYGKMLPARIVGGDCFDYVNLAGRISLMVADVCGKGLPAALFAFSMRNLYRIFVENCEDSLELVEQLNHYIFRLPLHDRFVTGLFAYLEDDTLIVTSAGHCAFLVYRQENGALEEYKPAGKPLGVLDSGGYTREEVTLSAGDRVLMYTDGVVEAVNGTNEEYGEDRLKEAFGKIAGAGEKRDAEASINALLEDVETFTGDREQFDDTTLLFIEKD